ncbi:MAG: hypothetical protein AAFV62_09460 [Pseudomonadota bacterium]
MAVFIFSGASGAHPEAWPSLLGQFSNAQEDQGVVINLSTSAGGAIAALAQLALAQEMGKGDVVVWDHAPALNACLETCDYDPLEALRAVEFFLRACVRRKVPVVPLVSDRLVDARMEEPGEIAARLWHLFDRFALTPISTATVLRRAAAAGKLLPMHFIGDGDIYKPGEPVNRLLARNLATVIDQARDNNAVPLPPEHSIYERTAGWLRLAVAANAEIEQGATVSRKAVGLITTEIVELAPGGRVRFETSGEVVGLAPILSDDGGLLRVTVEDERYRMLSRAPFSTVIAPLPEGVSVPSVGQISFAHHIGRKIVLSKPTGLVLHNVSHLVREGEIRTDLGAVPPPEPNAKAIVRVLALIERRPVTKTPKDLAAEAETETGAETGAEAVTNEKRPETAIG